MSRSIRAARGAFLLALAAASTPALAQGYAAQDPSATLSSSMRTLATSPKNFEALIAAGRASLELGDTQAAAGFFGRAEEVQPRSAWPQAGMGSAMVMMGDPRGALTYFTRAQQFGATQMTVALDRGLAFDLLGQQAQAQSDYRAALAGPSGDEARRRLALSLAISRDIKGAGDTIEPLLARRDPEALRINAFVLALAGDREGARRTIDAAMPGAGARFEPFFQILPVLRADEKAAAVHLGEFPKDAAQRYAQAQPIPSSPVLSIGGSSGPMPVQVTPPRPAPQQAAIQPARTPPKKRVEIAEAPRRAVRQAEVPNTWIASIRPSLDPSRYASTRRSRTRSEGAASQRQDADPEPRPVGTAPETTQAGLTGLLPAREEAEMTRVAAADVPPTVELTPLPQPDEQPAEPEAAAVPQSETEVQAEPEAELLPVGEQSPPPAATEPEPEPVANEPPPAPRPKLERAAPPAAPKPKVETRSRPKAEKKTAKSAEPVARYFVQLASGANADRLPGEYKRIRAKKPSLFSGRTVQVSKGKDLFRLVVGPFKTRDDSRDFVNELAKAGIDAFSYTAPDGLKFEKIAAR